MGYPNNYAYVAAKHGIVGLTKSMGLDLHQYPYAATNMMCGRCSRWKEGLLGLPVPFWPSSMSE